MDGSGTAAIVANEARHGLDPDWLRHGLELPLVSRLRVLGAALWLFSRKPRAFGAAWSRGDDSIPNPFVWMAAAVSLLTLLREQLWLLTPALKTEHALPRSFAASLGETLGPYLTYVATGIVAHGALRVLGSQRKLRTTVGVSLLAGAGPGSLVSLSLSAMIWFVVTRYGDADGVDANAPMWVRVAIAFFAVGPLLYFLIVFSGALAGAHGLPRWKVAVAMMVAFVAVGFMCGSVENATWGQVLKNKLGPHFHFWRDAHGEMHNGFSPY